MEYGCENCKIESMNYVDVLYDHTSANFEGMISLIDPKHSWVSKVNNLGKHYCLIRLA